jgi:hypothetical protein
VFTVPAAFRPSTTVYVSVDMFLSAPGRIVIQPSGAASVYAPITSTDATSFTSLEGVWYPLTGSGFTAITPGTGWSNAPFSTRNLAASASGGIVRLQGAINGGTSLSLFTLPAGMRPATAVYTPVGLCNAKKGRLYIQPSGAVNLNIYSGTGGGTMDDATCFTSLEGVSFGL